MKNINPKQYELRFIRFVFSLLIQILLMMAAATALFNLSGGHPIMGTFVVVCGGIYTAIITRVALIYIQGLKVQLIIEMRTIYGIELEKEIKELNLPETEEEESEEAKDIEKGGSRLGQLFGSE
jgi:hypothetical protein